MTTLISKLANYSHSSFNLFLNSILDLATIATISATVATKMLPLKRVVARSIFEFLFQSFNNERNENDKD